jgi:hypothetical protein
MYFDPSPDLSRSRSVNRSVESIEADLIAGLGNLDADQPKRREFWLRRARQAAETQAIANGTIAAKPSGVPNPTPVTIKNPTIKAKAEELIAQIPGDLSIPDFLRRPPTDDGAAS